MLSVASSITTRTSMPSSACATSSIIWRPRAESGRCTPGVSIRTICACGRLMIPWMRLRVVCGLGDTMATFWPTSRFTSVDLPTLGSPTMAANPERKLIAEASYTWERFADIARRENPVLEARNEALLSGVIHFRVVASRNSSSLRAASNGNGRLENACDPSHRSTFHVQRDGARRGHRDGRRVDRALRAGGGNLGSGGGEPAGGHRRVCRNRRGFDCHGPGRVPGRENRCGALRIRARARNSGDRRAARPRNRRGRPRVPFVRHDRGTDGAGSESYHVGPEALGEFHDAFRAGSGRARPETRGAQRADHRRRVHFRRADSAGSVYDVGERAHRTADFDCHHAARALCVWRGERALHGNQSVARGHANDDHRRVGRDGSILYREVDLLAEKAARKASRGEKRVISILSWWRQKCRWPGRRNRRCLRSFCRPYPFFQRSESAPPRLRSLW